MSFPVFSGPVIWGRRFSGIWISWAYDVISVYPRPVDAAHFVMTTAANCCCTVVREHATMSALCPVSQQCIKKRDGLPQLAREEKLMSRNVIRFVRHFAWMALTFAAGFCNLMAQQAAPAGWTDYTKKFDAAMENEHVVGAGVLVLQNGNLVSRHEYGFADQEKKKPVTEHTIFHYGSITKTL